MVTGDARSSAFAVARQLGLDRAQAEVRREARPRW